LNYVLNNPRTIRAAIELKAGRTSPQATAQSLSQVLNESFAQVTGSGASLTERAIGAGQGLIAGLQAANRGQTAVRQGGARALLADQEAVGPAPAPTRTSVPEVAMPVSIDDMQITQSINPEAIRQQMNLRERAKSNPYIASTLLGGLGNAGLL
jgi:hypothetical protein